MKTTINIVLKELREKKGLTQEEMAKELKISQSAYSYYERGERHPDIEIIMDMAEYFNIPIDLLVGRYKKAQ